MMKEDNFDFLRIVAAFSVLISHSVALHSDVFPLVDLGNAAVYSFFAISGFMVSGSWERDPNLFRFLSRRALRIFPGLAVVIAVAALLIGPLVTTVPLDQYFHSKQFASYCQSVFLFPANTAILPGVFENNPYKSTVNGSLWTLPMEVFMYGTLALLGLFRILGSRLLPPILLLTIAGCVWIAMMHLHVTFLTMDANELINCASCFLSGILLWSLQKKIVFFKWAWVVVLVLIAIFRWTPVEQLILLIGLPYAIISFGRGSVPFLTSFGRFGDLSYGIYIYAFLIQQTLMAENPEQSLVQFFISASILTLLAAFLSWHLIEKPSLKLKTILNVGRGSLRNRGGGWWQGAGVGRND